VVNLRVDQFYFDQSRVLRAAERAEGRNLTRIGAFVRRRARSSIRKRAKPSRPGQPPTRQTGRLRDRILFAVDRRGSSVVVGPRFQENATPAAALEFGGRTIATRRTNRGSRRRTFRIEARPYMRPALQAEIEAGTIDRVWANSVRGP
jgi:phage gpG-like protein